MPLNIPMPDDAGTSFLKGIASGSNLFSKIMNPILDREHQKQQAAQFAQQFALKKQQEQRASQIHELKTNPQKLYEFIQAIKQQGANSHPGNPLMNQGQDSGGGVNLDSNPDLQAHVPGEVGGNAQSAGFAQGNNSQAPGGGVFDNLNQDQQAMLQMAGIKIPTVKENPQQKRYADLQAKLQLENYKSQQRKALEEQKVNLKNVVTRQKTMDLAKHDLPHLQQTLDALNKMKKIATNNPDLFGHNGLFGLGAEKHAESFAKSTDNPNAGAWQTYGLGPIVAAESKMSSKGNQLALKQALANKPNFSENQKVALSKLDASIEQINKQIEDTRKISGEKEANKNVLKIAPLTKEEDSLLKEWSPQLIQINPEWTADNIKTTRDETGLSIGQVIEKLMAQGK